MKLTDLAGKSVAVCGMGISNLPLVDFLLKHNVKSITARDKKSRDVINSEVLNLEQKGIKLVLGDDYLSDLNEDIIFHSPGIRCDLPEFEKAKASGSVITSEMELFFRNCPATIIGITGSDGKTTTTTLISKLIEMQLGKVFLGGNIGKPLLPDIEQMTEKDYAVVELSSFQLHCMDVSADIAVVTNVAPNHLNWHTDMDEYVDSKKNIFKFEECKKLVINDRNEYTRDFGKYAPRDTQIVKFCDKDENGVYEKDGTIFCGNEPILKCSDIKIPGHHNVENYMAAIGAVYGIVDKENIVKLAKTFEGVEHRIEFVRELDGVKYYNSSIDSSPSRTEACLNAFNQKLIVIMGGYDKHIPYEPIAKPLCEKAKCIILCGATGTKIKDAVISSAYYEANKFPIIDADSFENAILLARQNAEKGDIVVLSPASASFDLFPNFEVRGRKFKEIVNGLK